MEAALITRLLANDGLSGLVGNRINWGERVQGEPLPAITMMIVSSGRRYNHGGVDGTSDPRVQFDIFGNTMNEARIIRDALKEAIEVRQTVQGISFSVSLLDAERGPLIEDVGGGKKVYRYSLDFFLWHSIAA